MDNITVKPTIGWRNQSVMPILQLCKWCWLFWRAFWNSSYHNTIIRCIERVINNFFTLFCFPPDLHTVHSQVVIALFDIRFKFKQGKWKNFPLWQNGLWHSSSLSEHSGFCLHVQIKPYLRASSKISHLFAFWFFIFGCWCFLAQGTKPLAGCFCNFQTR